MNKKKLLLAMLLAGVASASIVTAACGTEPLNGKSAYELYVDSFVAVNGSIEGVLNEDEWLISLKGEQGLQGSTGATGETGSKGEQGEKGDDGLSAYEIYKKYTNDNPVLNEEAWLESLKGTNGNDGQKGEDGKSAYELYVEAYKKAIGSEEGVLSEDDWLDSLNGIQGVGIEKTEIICGDLIITYSNDTQDILEDFLPDAGHTWNEGEVTKQSTCTVSGIKTFTCDDCEATKQESLEIVGHQWDEGSITTAATCLTSGVMTFNCTKCTETKKEIIDAFAENHVYGNYESNETHHWQICRLCGDVLKAEHGFDGASKDSDVDEILECECGINKTVGEFYSYKVIFECDDGASVVIYDTQDYSVDGIVSLIAYSRNETTGELLNNGNGQVNFEIILRSGFLVTDISVTNENNYKNLKTPAQVGRDNTYRITKITGEVKIMIKTAVAVAMYDFASLTSENGYIEFSWNSDYNLDYVNIEVLKDTITKSYTVTNNTWSIQLSENTRYSIVFEAYYNGNIIDSIPCSRFYCLEAKNIEFPRVEIITEGNVWPTCDYITHPTGCWGEGITNNNYVYSVLNVYNKDNALLYNSAQGLSQTDAYLGSRIKVRGNTSAYSDKKPYKIKLNTKIDLLSGLIEGRDNGVAYHDKEWLLLAGGSNLNQVVGWSISETLQFEYTPAYSYVELYINGDYRGLYILCESVKQGSGSGNTQSRCAVDDDGFIVELDAYWWKEDLYFETPLTSYWPLRYTFKYPDSDDIIIDSKEYIYIKNYITELEEALNKEDNSYLNFINEESFAKWLLAHDILADIDSAGSNIFLTKKDSSNSVLFMGPLWDFDNILRNTDTFSKIRTENFYYFPKLLMRNSFIEKYNELFYAIKDNIISNLEEKIDLIYVGSYNKLIDIESLRWNANYKDLDTQKSEIVDWFENHILWLEDNI